MQLKKFLKMVSFWTLLCTLLGCKSADNTFRSVSVTDFEQLISDSTVIRLDVRTAEEFNDGHIPGAININVNDTNFEKQCLTQIPEGSTVALYCRSGQRSKRAARLLSQHTYKIIDLDSGFLGWCQAGKETEK